MAQRSFPWQERPAGVGDVVWRSARNPVIGRHRALLDLHEPWKVSARRRDFLLAPQVHYEQVGDVQNVVFPTAALVDHETDRLTIYYGAADTVVCMAHGYLSEVVAAIR